MSLLGFSLKFVCTNIVLTDLTSPCFTKLSFYSSWRTLSLTKDQLLEP